MTTKLPDADRVEGAILEKSANWRLSTVEIQYKNGNAGLCSVTMNVPNALWLLTMLNSLMKEHGYDKHLQPPAQPPA